MYKRIIDVVMLLLLPILMAEILTGQQFHEWVGTGMLLLFIVHHILNLAWIKNMAKGKYTPSRSLGTMINLLLFCCMAALAVSGIMMSGFVFRFLRISGGLILARRLHLFASHWGMILLSAHLGMHMDMVMGVGRKMFHLSDKNVARTWILRILTAGVSIYGIVVFFTQNMPNYLFLKTAFVFFDDQKRAGLVLVGYAAMIWLFAALTHYLNRLLRVTAAKSGEKAWKAAAFLVPLVVCIMAVAIACQGQQTFPGQGDSFAGQPEETENHSGHVQGETVNRPEQEPAPSQVTGQTQPELTCLRLSL